MQFLILSILLISFTYSLDHLYTPQNVILNLTVPITVMKAFDHFLYYATNQTIYQLNLETNQTKSLELSSTIYDIKPWGDYIWLRSDQLITQVSAQSFALLKQWQQQSEEISVTDFQIYFLQNGKIKYMCYDCDDTNIYSLIAYRDLSFSHLAVIEYDILVGTLYLSFGRDTYQLDLADGTLLPDMTLRESISQLELDLSDETSFYMETHFISTFNFNYITYQATIHNDSLVKLEIQHPYAYYMTQSGLVYQWSALTETPFTIIQDKEPISDFTVFELKLFTLSENKTIVKQWSLPDKLAQAPIYYNGYLPLNPGRLSSDWNFSTSVAYGFLILFCIIILTCVLFKIEFKICRGMIRKNVARPLSAPIIQQTVAIEMEPFTQNQLPSYNDQAPPPYSQPPPYQV